MKIKCCLVTFLFVFGSFAYAGDCGLQPLKPIPPIGCKDTTPVCQCNSDEDCHWVFECVPEEVAELRLVIPLKLTKDVKIRPSQIRKNLSQESPTKSCGL